MDLKELDYIVTVANEGSISARLKTVYGAVELKPGGPPV